jgi:hypothetical protein
MKEVKRFSKKGQFFLIAAIIIVFVLFGMVAVTNRITTTKTEIALIDISDELRLESESTINFGISNQTDINLLLESFTQNYSSYLGEDTQLFFVYGTPENISYMQYRVEGTGDITLNIGWTPITIRITNGVIKREEIPNPDKKNKIDVIVSGITYNFDLKEGENFFFVIQAPRTER